MIDIYCRDNHKQDDMSTKLCKQCQALQDYVNLKLENCRFQENKPTCANCEIHCYRKTKQEEIKAVMRYSGPKMMFRHPVLAIRHLLDGR